MKKTTKIILSSALTMALSASLIAGSTLALFSSESKVDVSISAGSVEIAASVDQATLKGYSAKQGSSADVYTEEEAGGGTFTTGGTYKYEEETGLTLTGMAPGDAVEFEVKITNTSTIKVKYRAQLSVTTEIDGADELYKVLQVTFGDEHEAKTFSSKDTVLSGAWGDLEVGTKEATVKVKIKFPIVSGDQNQYKGKSCTFKVGVYAMQSNGYTGV